MKIQRTEGYLHTGDKTQCYGCEACVQICPTGALVMEEDFEGFRYPILSEELCIHCGKCNEVCPVENPVTKYTDERYTYGGYTIDEVVRDKSTSGGAFSVIVKSWNDKDSIIFGVESDQLEARHCSLADIDDLNRIRKSKYVQSHMNYSYGNCKKHLHAGKRVLFSGTPCQIAGLRTFLGNTEQNNLLTVEVICEGVPSPLYIRKYDSWCKWKYGSSVQYLDYRYKDQKKWDFEVMLTSLHKKSLKMDRWFNPFWSIWLNHLMSRPSCYSCPFTTVNRVADITLGDLWGVHLFCPELYGRNGGSSLVICNTAKGIEAFKKAEYLMYGHELDFQQVVKYQSPLRGPIPLNNKRDEFIHDLQGDMDYKEINQKWAKKPTVRLVWSKYFWGNRQKVLLWNIQQRILKKR